jgi:cytochrome c oxidase subunit 1
MTRLDPALDLRTSRTDPVPDELAELERTWRSPPGFYGWFTHVNHTGVAPI